MIIKIIAAPPKISLLRRVLAVVIGVLIRATTGTRLAKGSHGLRERITGTPLRLDHLRISGIDLDFAPETQYRDVDRAIVDLEAMQSRLFEKLLAGQCSLRGGKKCAQETELAFSQ